MEELRSFLPVEYAEGWGKTPLQLSMLTEGTHVQVLHANKSFLMKTGAESAILTKSVVILSIALIALSNASVISARRRKKLMAPNFAQSAWEWRALNAICI